MTRKAKALLAGVLVVGVMTYLALWNHSNQDPTSSFTQNAGQRIPDGVSVIAYRELMDDALLHKSRYWLLRGEPAALRKLATDPKFGPSLEDARYALPNMPELFNRPWQASDIVAGFEQDHGRGRWYWIFKGEREALYAIN